VPFNVKCVIQFATELGWGWSETHYYLSSASGAPNLQARIDDLRNVVGPARAALLGLECSIIGFRVSYPRPGAIASRSSRIQIAGSTTEKGSDMAQSLAVEFIDSSQSKSKITHLRGFWDAVESNQSYHPEEAPGWDERLLTWKQSLIGRGYGWLTVNDTTSIRGTVNNYESATNGQIEFELTNIVNGPLVVGDIVTVTFSKINGSNSVLNHSLVCEVGAADSVFTVAPIAAGPFTGKGKFKIRKTEFVAYSETDSISVGKRAAGKPLNRSPGRLSARART